MQNQIREITKNPYPQYVKDKIEEELRRFETMPAASAESNVVRTYIDWMLKVPWYQETKDVEDIQKVEDVLNALNLNEWPWQPQEKGRNGYNRSLKLQEYATVYFNEIKYTEIPSGREDLLERYKKWG